MIDPVKSFNLEDSITVATVTYLLGSCKMWFNVYWMGLVDAMHAWKTQSTFIEIARKWEILSIHIFLWRNHSVYLTGERFLLVRPSSCLGFTSLYHSKCFAHNESRRTHIFQMRIFFISLLLSGIIFFGRKLNAYTNFCWSRFSLMLVFITRS